jgi:hypothetical protein
VLLEFGSDLVVEAIGPGGARRWPLIELLPEGFHL